MSESLRLGWFTSARGPGSRAMYEAVADALASGALDARFAFVFCNREPGEDAVTDAFFERVRAGGAPLVRLSSVRVRREAGGERSRPGAPLPAWRTAYDAAVEAALTSYPFDLGVLAGYMLIFGSEFVSRHALLNLHPALPDGPAGTWREVIRHLIRARAAESGVMLHLAIPKVDMGPVVAYCRYALHGADLDAKWARVGDATTLADDAVEASELFAAIRRVGMVRESPLLLATLAEFAAGRRRTDGAQILDAAGKPAPSADLTAEVDTLITDSEGWR